MSASPTPMQTVPPGDTTVAPTLAQFLADFVEFDTTNVTDPNALQFSPNAIQYWINFAQLVLNQGLWGRMYYSAVELFAAHNLSLEAWAAQGGPQSVPGIAKGMIAGVAASNVSVNYNNEGVLAKDAEHWNFTVFGMRLIRYIRMMGAGPRQVGVGCPPPGWFQFVPGLSPYSGPPVYNTPNPSGW
jgi:Protein of unknown function (DUF4054)